MSRSVVDPCAVCGEDAGSDIETRAVVDVLAMLHGRIEAALAAGEPVGEAQLPDLAGEMLQDAAEVWKHVSRRAVEEAEEHLAGIAVGAILALVACRRARR